MATTIQPPSQTEAEQTEVEQEKIHPNDGGGGFGSLIPAEGKRAVEDRPGEPARTAIWVALAAIAMSFAALTSALFVREGAATDWHHIPLPSILYFNTLALIASSMTLEYSRKKVAAYMRGIEVGRSPSMFWLSGTLLLGLVFVAGQYLAWLRLRSEGLYLPTNPNSSFFYLLTGVHVVHVLGGLAGLMRVLVIFRSSRFSLRRSTLDATSYYWHFMGMLWLYLLFVLWWKL
jgi:cytochrome c oxidase subunit 3